MKNFNKKLTVAYNTKLGVSNIEDAGTILVLGFSYLRDNLLLKIPDDQTTNPTISTALNALVVAVDELKLWQNSISDEQKDIHWNTFCELIKTNMKEWLTLNDSV